MIKIIKFNILEYYFWEIMKKTTFILLLIVSTVSFAQSNMEGYIFDKTTKDPLPYATIEIINNGSYTITNENGKFEIKEYSDDTTLKIRYLGYESIIIPITYFNNNSKFYLTPVISELNEVVVVSDKDYAYNLLNELIQKYRKNQVTTKSKAFLTLTSFARNTPLEQIEGFYNSSQSFSEGIVDLKIKSGRFGQNRSFPFYSLDNNTLLKDFSFFRKSDQILPTYPGNLSLQAIKSKYRVKVDECNSCLGDEIIISFIPKKFNGRLFSGKIYFNIDKLILRKIDLRLINPEIKQISSIIENDIVNPTEVLFKISFNPLNNKIQYLDFTLKMYYSSGNMNEIIKSHSFLYFYDYGNSFTQPYFTNSVDFNSDYDKIIALKSSSDFWELNYQFPKSYSEISSNEYLTKYGYLINYNSSSIPSSYIKYIKPSVLLWDKNKRVEWSNIKHNLTEPNKKEKQTYYKQGLTLQSDNSYNSILDLKRGKKNGNELINMSYVINSYENKIGEINYISRTIFDRNSSYYSKIRTKNKLIYINLVFDIYEYYREIAISQLKKSMELEDVNAVFDEKFKEATVKVDQMKKETNYGSNYQNLIRWNNKIKLKLNIDNFALITENK